MSESAWESSNTLQIWARQEAPSRPEENVQIEQDFVSQHRNTSFKGVSVNVLFKGGSFLDIARLCASLPYAPRRRSALGELNFCFEQNRSRKDTESAKRRILFVPKIYHHFDFILDLLELS